VEVVVITTDDTLDDEVYPPFGIVVTHKDVVQRRASYFGAVLDGDLPVAYDRRSMSAASSAPTLNAWNILIIDEAHLVNE
jgi:hypothetical protein